MTTASRVVLVTGASSGIGEATVLRAAARGDHVVLVARGEQALQRVASACRDGGAASALVLPTDVKDDAAVERAVAHAVREHGRLDLVVSNAGVVGYGRTEEVPAEVFDGVLDTNLHGAVNVVRHTVPVLRAQQQGSLVLVGSVIGHIAVPGMAAYVLSKWGVRALARQLRIENRDLPGVHIGYVSPGGTDTPIYAQAANYGSSLGRPPFPVATPERVADRILAVAERPRRRSQVGLSNDVIRFGFAVLPGVYDAWVGPLFRIVAQDLTRPVQHGPGNVLRSRSGANALRGGWNNALLGVARNVGVLLRGRRGGDT